MTILSISIVLCLIVYFIGSVGYDLGYADTNQELKDNFEKCEIEKAELIQENKEIKEDIGMLLIEYYGKPIAWDFVGLTKYKKLVCALKIILKDDIPIVNKIPC